MIASHTSFSRSSRRDASSLRRIFPRDFSIRGVHKLQTKPTLITAHAVNGLCYVFMPFTSIKC
jgi:hypothetical protein